MLQRLICFGLLILGSTLWIALPGVHGQSFELNADGRQLIVQATQACDSDMRDRPVMADVGITAYMQGITQRLISCAKPLPSGVQLHIAALNSPKPKIYAYTDGHLMLNSGLLFGVDNEAKFAGAKAALDELCYEQAHKDFQTLPMDRTCLLPRRWLCSQNRLNVRVAFIQLLTRLVLHRSITLILEYIDGHQNGTGFQGSYRHCIGNFGGHR